MSISGFMVLMGGIILLGVFGNYFFSKTRVPTPVILILFGVILGPIAGVVSADQIKFAAPYFGTIALILILFEGGLDLELKAAATSARLAAIIGITTFILTAVAVTTMAMLIFQLELKIAILFGLVLSGTSPAVILPILKGLQLTKETSALFTLESVISEVLTVALAVLASDIIARSGPGSSIMSQVYFVAHMVWASFLVALIFGWIWNWIMPLIEQAGLSHMLTLAWLFLLYAVSEWVHAEPAVTVLLFGLLLENGHDIISIVRKWVPPRIFSLIDFPLFTQRQLFGTLFSEITFLVRSFFFVLIGLIINFNEITLSAWIGAAFFVCLFYISRRLVVLGLEKLFNQVSLQAKSLGSVLIPRGLATAVVALMVADKVPDAKLLVPVAFLVILGSNLVMAGQVIFRWRELSPEQIESTDHRGPS